MAISVDAATGSITPGLRWTSIRLTLAASLPALVDHIRALDDRVGQQFGGDALHVGGGGVGIEQEDAAGRNVADVDAEFTNLLLQAPPGGILRGGTADVDAIDHEARDCSGGAARGK